MKPRGSKSKLLQTCTHVLTKTSVSQPQRKPRHRHREAATSQALQQGKGNSVKMANTTGHTKNPQTEPAAIIVRRGGKTQSYFRPLPETIHRRPHGDSAVPWCVEACGNIALESHLIVVGVPEGVVELPALQYKTPTSEVTATECDGQSAADDNDEIDESLKDVQKVTDAVLESQNDGASASSRTSLEELARIVQELSKVAEDLRLCRLSAEHLDHDTTQPGDRNSKLLPQTRERSERTKMCMSTRCTTPNHLDECSVETLRDQEVSPSSAAALTFDLSPKHVGVKAAGSALLLEEEQTFPKTSSLPANDSSSENFPYSCSDDSDVVDIDIDEYFATLQRDVLHEDFPTSESMPRSRGSDAPARSVYAKRHASETSCRPSPRLLSPGPGMKPNPRHGSKPPRNYDKCRSSHDCESVLHVCPSACTHRSSAKESSNSVGHQEQLSSVRRNDGKAPGVEVTQHGGVGHKRPGRAHHPVQYDPDIEKSRTFNHQRGNAFTKVSRWLRPLTRGLRTLQVHYAHANAEHNDRLIFAHLLRAAHVRNAAVEEGVYVTERRLYARRHDNTPHATTFYNTDDVIKRALKRGSRAAADRHNTKP